MADACNRVAEIAGLTAELRQGGMAESTVREEVRRMASGQMLRTAPDTVHAVYLAPPMSHEAMGRSSYSACMRGGPLMRATVALLALAARVAFAPQACATEGDDLPGRCHILATVASGLAERRVNGLSEAAMQLDALSEFRGNSPAEIRSREVATRIIVAVYAAPLTPPEAMHGLVFAICMIDLRR